jgi:hypothetical protein
VRQDEVVGLAPNFDKETAKALGRLVHRVLNDPSRWDEFHADPIGTAEKEGVEITDKTKRVILALADQSDDVLGGLSRINETLIKEEVFYETGNFPLMVY